VTAHFNGHSMVGPLRRVMVCTPQAAGWNDPSRTSRWRELGFHHAPDFTVAQEQHRALCEQLEAAGSEVLHLPAAEQLTLDAVYTHDASLPTDYGMVLMRPGKANRMVEAQTQRDLCQGLGIPIFGQMQTPGTTEAGDLLWLDARTLLAGHGYRTNRAGINALRAMLAPKGIDAVAAPLPYAGGPAECMHLMSLISLLDENTALVDLPWLAVETVELLRARAFEFIEIDPSERSTLACNVLSLGRRRLLALEENPKTNQKLRDAGFDVRTCFGSELCVNGSGGPTCLTRPLLRG
jgi:N-dimethylarginine dimethylaminohydrolase